MNWRQAHPDLVEHDAMMNSHTEYYEPEGTKLENGMRVLVANGQHRAVLKLVNELTLLGVLAVNRWCKVTKLQIVDGWVMFLGVYDDGSVVPRKYRPEVGWLIKRNSVPKRAKVRALVEEMLDLDRAHVLNSVAGEIEEEYTDKFMKLFGGTE